MSNAAVGRLNHSDALDFVVRGRDERDALRMPVAPVRAT